MDNLHHSDIKFPELPSCGPNLEFPGIPEEVLRLVAQYIEHVVVVYGVNPHEYTRRIHGAAVMVRVGGYEILDCVLEYRPRISHQETLKRSLYRLRKIHPVVRQYWVGDDQSKVTVGAFWEGFTQGTPEMFLGLANQGTFWWGGKCTELRGDLETGYSMLGDEVYCRMGYRDKLSVFFTLVRVLTTPVGGFILRGPNHLLRFHQEGITMHAQINQSVENCLIEHGDTMTHEEILHVLETLGINTIGAHGQGTYEFSFE